MQVATSALLLAAAVSVACTEKKQDPPQAPPVVSPSPSPTEPAAEAPAEGKCAALGCTGEGSFFDRCDCKGKPQTAPLKATRTGKYDGFLKRPEFEVTNTTDKDIHWGSVAVYYYDGAGKQLETTIRDTRYKVSRMNGSSFALKPNQPKTLTMGFQRENEPKGVKAIEVVFDGWCFGTYAAKSTHLCVNAERAPEERARSGG